MWKNEGSPRSEQIAESKMCIKISFVKRASHFLTHSEQPVTTFKGTGS